jgi:hypothetical protein
MRAQNEKIHDTIVVTLIKSALVSKLKPLYFTVY